MLPAYVKINVEWKPLTLCSALVHYDIELRLLLTNLFIYGSFNDAFDSSDYAAPRILINNELERTRKERVVALRYYPGIYLEGLRKPTEILSQNSRDLPYTKQEYQLLHCDVQHY
jgi:hypothetical protein